jgi:hypothetical protein
MKSQAGELSHRTGVFLSILALASGAVPAFSNTCDVPSPAYSTIRSAVDDSRCDEVDIAAGTYDETFNIERPVIVSGDPSSPTVIDGGFSGSVVTIGFRTGTATLNDLTFRHGAPAGPGGGVNIASFTTVVMNRCTITANSALGRDVGGGGIYVADGDITLNSCSIRGNGAPEADGGGLYVAGGEVTLSHCTVESNTAGGDFGQRGGGIFTLGTVHVVDSTIAGNIGASVDIEGQHVVGSGGGVYNQGVLDIVGSTLARNVAEVAAGIDGPATLMSSIVAENNASNCGGTITDDGYNMADDATCAFSAAGSANSVSNLNLGPIGDNGGPTRTIALLVPSAAIDRIPAGTNGCGTTQVDDQRGVSRPQDGRCDIGAFEVEASSLPCPRPLGFWKNAPSPVPGLVIGGKTYTAAELAAILSMPARGDASLILADQLIPAMFNVAEGAAEAQEALDAIASANTLLSPYGRLPLRLRPPRSFEFLALADTLSAYNGGVLTPGCLP